MAFGDGKEGVDLVLEDGPGDVSVDGALEVVVSARRSPSVGDNHTETLISPPLRLEPPLDDSASTRWKCGPPYGSSRTGQARAAARRGPSGTAHPWTARAPTRFELHVRGDDGRLGDERCRRRSCPPAGW